MIRTALLPLPVWKEIRALAFPWLACIVVMIVPDVVDAPRFVVGVSAFAYFLGAAALGALSIGHEYTGRTLSLLLSLPARRERLLLVKLGVLSAMLLALWMVADALVFRGVRTPQTALPVLCALFLAPWLTMACRNPIAGTVFTLAIPAVLSVLGDRLGVAMYGSGREMAAFRMALLWRGTLGVCAIGAVMSWRTFMRLEAIEGPGQDVRLPAFAFGPFAALRRGRPQWLGWRTARSFTKRNPVWLLVKKELRLQEMPLVVAGLYLVGWLAVVSSRPLDVDGAFILLTLFYMGLMALLIGSFASAGERQLRTLEWQLLMPLAMSKQWAVKVGVALGLAMLLALGLPAMCASLNPALDLKLFLRPEVAVVIVLLTAVSLYVSSLCNSGLWALLMSLPTTFGAVLFVSVATVRVFASRLAGGRAPTGFGPGSFALTRLLMLLLVAAFIAIALRFALANHRAADRPAGRVWKQAIVMGAFVTAGVMILAGVDAFGR